MTKAEFNIKEHANPEDNSALDDSHGKVIPMRKVRPLLIASGVTLIWVFIAIYLIQQKMDSSYLLDLNNLSALTGGILLPIVLFWLIALVFQRTDPLLERRVSMMQTLNTALSPIDLAEKRLESIDNSIHTRFNNIKAAAEMASKSMDKLEDRFEKQTNQLFAATADVETKSAVIRDRLSRASSLYSEISGDIDGKHSNIKSDMENLKVSLDDTNKTIKETIDAAIEKTRNQANIATEASLKITSDITKSQITLSEQTKEVMETSNIVEQKLSDVNMALITNTDRLRDDITELDTFASDIVDAMRKEILLVEEMSVTASDLTEKIEKSLTEQVTHVQSAADNAIERTADAGNILKEHAMNIAAIFNQTLENAKDAASKTVEDIALQTKEASQLSAAEYSQITSNNKALTEHILESSSAVTNLLDETLERARNTMSEIGNQITQQGDNAETATNSVANNAVDTLNTLQQQVTDSLNLFTETIENNNDTFNDHASMMADHTTLLASTAETANVALREASETLDSTGAGFGQSMVQNRHTLSLLEDDIHKHQENLETLSLSLNDTLKEANSTIEKSGATLRDEADEANNKITYMNDTLSVTTKNIVEFGKSSEESMTSLAEKIHDETQHIRVDIDLSTRSFKEASVEVEAERKHLKLHVEDISELLRSSSEKLRDRINDITKAATEASGTGDNMISGLSGLTEQYESAMENALTQFQDALVVAEENSTKLSRTLSGEADRVRDEATNFLSKTKEIEERITKATKGDFLRTTNMLVDSLQTTAIDINKLLEDDIPDDVWDEYIAGDHSIFARRAIKLTSTESKEAVVEKYIEDKKFREQTGTFMKDFESLMERSMHGDKGSAMSITLISSTMGKLYVLLAQSLKKVN